ncbi:LOW QUALITY PROTEIN: hypothetical protein OSB04_029582 [Centaurea solstitialis]|uniref:Uncharacterized protein n=1 Tax=Centaurea solstitialis TaxID=347529 RepID=A0AA38S569_9ASTR|nr:LOW QUALITY PROTEIN: hypothetical protein OSB04_029582 [Centaurea solstitialis]
MGIHDSSSSSSSLVKPSFRELDDVFLQSQARIWLGEVLHTRFDELLSICDLLSDGELLFEVSKALWNMLLVKYMELNNFKDHMVIPVDTRKISGRYRPYSNVDSFLKASFLFIFRINYIVINPTFTLCKLFIVPSAVQLHVCKVMGLSGVDLFSHLMSWRRETLGKYAYVYDLYRRKRGPIFGNSGYSRVVPDFDNVTKTIAMPTDVVRCIRRSLELSTCSVTHEQSKDARLKFRQKSSSTSHKQEEESCLEESDDEKSDLSDASYADFLYLESGESPEVVDDKYALTQSIKHVDTKKQEMDMFAHIPGSAESIVLQYVCSDNQLDGISPPVCESRLMMCNELTPVNHGEDFWHNDGENAISMQNMGEVDHHISLSNSLSFRIRRKFPDDIEPSSVSSVSTVVGRVLDFDFDAMSEPDDVGISTSEFGTKLENFDFDFADSISPSGEDANLYRSVDQDLESLNHVSETQRCLGDSFALVKGNVVNVTGNIEEIGGKGLNIKKEDDQLCTNQSDDLHCYAEDRTKAASKHEIKEDGVDFLAEANTNGRNDKRSVNPEKKPTYIMPLMKTVAKGTALIGILFLFHLRITSDRNRDRKVLKKSSEIHWKSKGNGEKGSKIYPAEKFRFGD